MLAKYVSRSKIRLPKIELSIYTSVVRLKKKSIFWIHRAKSVKFIVSYNALRSFKIGIIMSFKYVLWLFKGHCRSSVKFMKSSSKQFLRRSIKIEKSLFYMKWVKFSGRLLMNQAREAWWKMYKIVLLHSVGSRTQVWMCVNIKEVFDNVGSARMCDDMCNVKEAR